MDVYISLFLGCFKPPAELDKIYNAPCHFALSLGCTNIRRLCHHYYLVMLLHFVQCEDVGFAVLLGVPDRIVSQSRSCLRRRSLAAVFNICGWTVRQEVHFRLVCPNAIFMCFWLYSGVD